MIKILDNTLREGEQSPGVFFTVEEKLELAKMLDEFGVDIIEAGHPMVSAKIEEAVKLIKKQKLNAEIMGHARPVRADIDKVIECETDWIGLIMPSSDLHLTDKLHMTREKAMDMVVDAIDYCKAHGLKIRYTPEDATRSDFNYLLSCCKRAEEAGATRISIADTVGIATPESFFELVSKIRKEIKTPLNLHCHNDFGLALANALAGVRAGATLVDASVNGLGERAGVVDLMELGPVLKILTKQECRLKLEMIPAISKFVEKSSGIYMAANKPITGENVFSHKGGMHTDGVIKNPKTYEAFEPGLIGRERKIVVDRYTGKLAARQRLEEYGITVNDDELLSIVMEIKKQGDEYKFIHDTDIIAIAEKITGRKSVIIPKGIDAVIFVSVESHTYTTSIVRKLSNFPGILDVFEVTGENDIGAYIQVKNTTELNNVIEHIRTLPGVMTTNTHIVLKKYPGKNGSNGSKPDTTITKARLLD